MPGQRRADRDFRRFTVTDLTDHDDIGVLPQNRAQTGGKRHAGLVADLHLVDAGQSVFHRVLDRNDVLRRRVQLGQHRIEGGGFAGAGRAGDQDHPVSMLVHFAEFAQVVR